MSILLSRMVLSDIDFSIQKISGTFKNGRYTVEKDTAQHGGRRWKLKKDGRRIGSLDKDGNIIAD
ncbi:hypothetical protein ACVV62_00765 [Streptococcus pluranimalium]